MTPGFYVVRIGQRGYRLIPESVRFPLSTEGRKHADSWCEFIKSERPKDQVFVIEVFPHEN